MHPGEYAPRPTTLEQRLSLAKRLKKEEKVPFPIIVDDIRNEVRKLYHALTNPVFIVDRQGILVYKSSWTCAGFGASPLRVGGVRTRQGEK